MGSATRSPGPFRGPPVVGSAIHVPGQAPRAPGQFQVTLLLLLRVLAKLWAWGGGDNPRRTLDSTSRGWH